MDDKTLVELAREARERSYSPYSRFAVGAALLCADGSVYQGCNVENAAYSPSLCAERTAFARANYEGHRDFVAIAVMGGYSGGTCDSYCAPCGVCRQVMMEFCDPQTFRVILWRGDGEMRSYLLGELLPEGFGPANLEG